MKSGDLNFLEPSGPSRPVTGLLLNAIKANEMKFLECSKYGNEDSRKELQIFSLKEKCQYVENEPNT